MSSDVMEAARLKRWEACATAWAAITCRHSSCRLGPCGRWLTVCGAGSKTGATAWAATSCSREHTDLHAGNSLAVYQAGSKMWATACAAMSCSKDRVEVHPHNQLCCIGAGTVCHMQALCSLSFGGQQELHSGAHHHIGREELS